MPELTVTSSPLTGVEEDEATRLRQELAFIRIQETVYLRNE